MSNERKQREGRTSSREEKKAQFTQAAKGGSRLKLAVVVLALAGLAGYLVFAGVKGGDDTARPTKAADVKPAADSRADEVRVPLKELEGGKAVFFEPRLASGKSVRFFVVKAADNTYRAALDACEVCFHAKKGYEQKGSDMICRNCGRDFAIGDIGPHNEDGCHPIALTQKVEGDQLVIKTSELEKGSSYF
ncbi:MAG TPA: DUF2318 domain-containing protein [Pyrinomonadaceae bacterium]|nr:DUF2318 domain-containing protein [Pyrinomonadaceae bacterium]